MKDRHQVLVDGEAVVSGPGHLTPDEAAAFVSAYINANPGAVTVTIQNTSKAYRAASNDWAAR